MNKRILLGLASACIATAMAAVWIAHRYSGKTSAPPSSETAAPAPGATLPIPEHRPSAMDEAPGLAEPNEYAQQDANVEAWISSLMTSFGKPREYFDIDTLYMMHAFQFGDEALVRARMQELLERDVSSALETMAKLDTSFIVFGVELPYETVTDYLLENYTPEAGLNLMGQMVYTSQSIREVGTLLFQRWGEQDLEGQLQWIGENSSFGNKYVFIHYIDDMMQRDGQSAYKVAEAMLNLPLDDARAELLVSEALKGLACFHPMIASEVLNGLPMDDPLYYEAISLVALNGARENGPLAMQWATSIPDPDMRMSAQISAGSTFLENDPAGFYEWLNSTDLGYDEASLAELLTQIEENAVETMHYEPDDPSGTSSGNKQYASPRT